MAAVRAICHRAKNDLQALANLAALAAPLAASPKELAQWLERRAGAMSVPYTLVSERRETPTLELLAKSVVERVALRHGAQHPPQLSLEPIPLSLRLCAALTLWLHEVADNAMAHGGAGQSGLEVRGGWQGDELAMTVRDRGPGDPSALAQTRDAHLGLRLARAVAETDLGGRMWLERAGPGVLAGLTVPRAAYERLMSEDRP